MKALFLVHGREGIVCLGDAYGGTLQLIGLARLKAAFSADRQADTLNRRPGRGK